MAVLMLGVIIGSRLLFVLVSLQTPEKLGGVTAEFYKHHLLEVVQFWHGGMSFYGGLIGAIVAGSIFATRAELPKLPIADETVLWAPIALAMGRIATMLLGSLPGRTTTSPVGIHFADVSGSRYPWQLFDAGALLFVLFPVLWILRSRVSVRRGFIFWTFITGYGLIRTLVEFYRQPGWVLWGLSAAQYVSIAMISGGIIMLLRFFRVKRGRPRLFERFSRPSDFVS